MRAKIVDPEHEEGKCDFCKRSTKQNRSGYEKYCNNTCRVSHGRAEGKFLRQPTKERLRFNLNVLLYMIRKDPEFKKLFKEALRDE